MADTWMIVFILVGIIVLAIGMLGGYMAYVLDAAVFFPVWMFVALIGLVLTLIGFAMGMQEKSKEE